VSNITLKYGSEKHKKLLDALKNRKRLWYKDTATKRERWKKDLETHRAYVHESTDDAMRKNKAGQTNVGEYTQITVPYSYGLVMAFHTYLSSVFLARSPVLQYQERHGSSDTNVQAVEAIMDYQTNIGGHLVPYYVWLMDATKHGLGVVGTYWEDEMIRVSKIIEEKPSFGGFEIPGVAARKVKRTIEVPGYKGNKLFNVRPHDFIFDTRVSLNQFQTGEFAGRMLDLSWLDVLDGAEAGRYINIRELKRMSRKGGGTYDEHRDYDEGIVDLPRGENDNVGYDPTEEMNIPETGRLEGYELFIRLVPSNWGLGKSNKSEKWVFTVANDVIIEARPFGELHDKFPYGVIETEIDGHTLFKRSMLEISEPLNNVLSWLINTHFFNIRKTLNNSFVADPSRIVMKDFKNQEQGMMIRMRPEAYGQPIASMVHQFQTQDVTGTHMQDTKVITELMQQITGVNSQLMGMLTGGGRKTATEVRGSTGFSMNRLKTQAEYISAMGFAPLSQMMVQSTQQHLDIERRYKLTGDLMPSGQRDVMVSPESITGFWDYIAVDGTMPVDKLAQANLWKELMMGMGQNEQLMQEYDIGSVFAYTAQLSGAKNIGRFKVQAMQDEQLQSEVEKGNMIPTGESNGNTTVSDETFTPRQRSGRLDDGRLEDTANRINESKQLPGVGPLS